jgi:hypothetical protein
VFALPKKSGAGLPDFSWSKHTKTGNIKQITVNYIYQMAGKYFKWSSNVTTFSIQRPSKIYPNWDFCYENQPSGNPGLEPILRLMNLQLLHTMPAL